jgi:hypothetical protein
LVLTPATIVQAVDVTWIGPDGGNWNTPANWLTVEGNNFPPAQDFGEAGAIGNNTTAVLSTQAMSVFGGVPAPVDVGGVKLGTIAGAFGGLRLTSGGFLTSRVPDSIPGETGAIQVGIAGQGILTVLGGATLNGTSLSSGGATGSSITLGDATASTATLSLTEGANLARTTTIVGPNVNFNATGNLALTNTHTLVANIRHATNHSALKTEGAAAINGTLKPMFTGVTPSLGNKWTLIDAAGAINGNFSNVDASMAPAVPGGVYRAVPAMSGGRNLLQLSLEEVLTLEVNRETGAASIRNIGPTAKTIDGYSILSPHGSLTGAWNSLDDQNVVGANVWVEAGPTANALSELIPGAPPGPVSQTLNTGTTLSLGTPYAKTFPAFGVDPDDLVFEYAHPDGTITQGQVIYTGAKTHNNFVLNVDPATGAVAFRNDSPIAVSIDGYSIYSDSGSLVPGSWNSLDDQNISDWEQAPPAPSASAVAELKADGSTTFLGQTGFSLGNLFTTVGATQDLRFEFLQAGNPLPSIGTVVYGPFTAPTNPGVGITGDYNNNGTVDAADYVLWRNGGPLQNDPTEGVQPADYDVWRANFGRTGAAASGAALAAAVPEPSTAIMLLLAVVSTLAPSRATFRLTS